MNSENRTGWIAYETMGFSVLNPMPTVSIFGPAVKEIFKHFTNDEIELLCSEKLTNEQIQEIHKRSIS